MSTPNAGATERGGCQVDPGFGPNTGKGKTPRHCKMIMTDVNCTLQRLLKFGIYFALCYLILARRFVGYPAAFTAVLCASGCPISVDLPSLEGNQFNLMNMLGHKLFSSAAARLLRLQVRIPRGSWMSVYCECCVLWSRGVCEGPIPLPEVSCRVCCVCDLETSTVRWPRAE